MNSTICPKIELVKDFMAVLITCKSDEDLIKNEIVFNWTTFSLVYGPSRAGNSHTNTPIRAKIENYV